MSTATALTPEEMLDLPDEGKSFDLVGGELVEKPMSMQSSRAGVKLLRYLDAHVDAANAGWVFGPDQGFRCFGDSDDPDRIRRPDVSFVPLKKMPAEAFEDEGYCPYVPDIVAEVISPNDRASEVEAKRDEWLYAGVRTVWILDPDAKTVRVHRADGGILFLRENDALTEPELLPGFAVRVADLFRRPSPNPP